MNHSSKKNHFSDLDGTLIAWGTETLVINQKLIDQLFAPGDILTIVTNQGGIPYYVMGNNKMPSPRTFVERIATLRDYLTTKGVVLSRVHVSLYHPSSTREAAMSAAQVIKAAAADYGLRISSYWGENARKPSPMLLRICEADAYMGDGDEDYMAALNAGVPFTWVTRFTGDK